MFKISIIIPCFKSMTHIKQLIAALDKHTIYPIHEAILVNDGSPDISELREFVRDIKPHIGFDIKLIEREKNRGFAFTCNEGADHAEGEYLLFLNFDTIPQPGWLTALANFSTRHKNAGVLGSRLLYPGVNLIQHVGGGFNKEKKPCHIYKGQPAFLPIFNKNRRLQWVTGASLFIKKNDFHTVSGFDETFITSSEDVDLCFKVRFKLGKDVWMVSDSILYHYTDVTGATSQNIERTHPIFINRWRREIIPDEERIYEEDGFSPGLLDLMTRCGIHNDFGTTLMVMEALNIETVEAQRVYVKAKGVDRFKKDLDSITRHFPKYDFIIAPTGNLNSLDKFSIQRLIGILSSPTLSPNEKQSLFSQLKEKLDSIHFFTILYNMASMLAVNNENEKAENLFSFLSEFLEKSDPQLAGKSYFKRSELTLDIEQKKEFLTRCLKLYPDHKRAHENLKGLENISV